MLESYAGKALELRAAGDPSKNIRLTTDGNVGIGTAIPNEKLEVQGNIRLSSTGDISTTTGTLTISSKGGDGSVHITPSGTGTVRLTNLTSPGFVKTDSLGDLSVDNNTYITENDTITLSGDVNGSGKTLITTTIGTGKVTNDMLSGSIANSKLANSTISGVALGSSLHSLIIGSGLSGISYNGSADITIAHTNTITSGNTGPSENTSLDYGSSFIVPYVNYDSNGHIISTVNKVMTLPDSDNVNTATHKDGIMDGSNTGTEVSYEPYTTQQTKLSFDISTDNPTLSDRLNLNGYLYATKLYSNGNEVLTAHPTISAASSVNNTGRTYIQDISLDPFGHITGIVSATETVVDT